MRPAAMSLGSLSFVIAIVLISSLSGTPALAACSTSPGVGVDWSKCEKRRLNLTGQNLSGGTFVDTDFDRTDLKNVKLMDSDLRQADVGSARLEGADLSKSKMMKLQGDRANFRQAKLQGADMTKAEVERADFSGANLSGAVMVKTELGRANLSGAVLDGADMTRAEIARAVFEGSSLVGTNFHDAYTYLTNFEGTDLSQAEGLVQEQLNVACGDDTTVLPTGLERPSRWPCGPR